MMSRWSSLAQVFLVLIWLGLHSVAWIIDIAPLAESNADHDVDHALPWHQDIVVIKVGGSSITNKAVQESLNQDALDWFAKILAAQMDDYFVTRHLNESCPANYTNPRSSAFVVIHGAGSFGHHTAKQYELEGKSSAPPTSDAIYDDSYQNRQMLGLAETRLSVRTLNHHVVSSFIKHGIHAVGISPCFGVPGMQAHGAGSEESLLALQQLIYSTLQAGLIPVLHGDACLYGRRGAGILSGDTLMELLAKNVSWVSRAVFLTDVDGVYSSDPKTNPQAELLRTIQVDAIGGSLAAVDVAASASSHDHDVTGGLKVRRERGQANTKIDAYATPLVDCRQS